MGVHPLFGRLDGILGLVNQQGSRKRTVALVLVAALASIVLGGGFVFAVFRFLGDETKGLASAADETATSTVRVNSAPSPKTPRAAPSVQQMPIDPSASVPNVPAQRGRGDLGLGVPITAPSCDGTGIVVIQSAVDPASYTQEISAALSANPGASYLRTDSSCPSLRQRSDAGNPIYAVYRPAGSTTESICAAVDAAPVGSYGKWLDLITDPTAIISC